jgi:hypothetical protein
MTYIKNREALAHLLEWLDNGAPEFNMDVGIAIDREEGTDPACGTTCCIAGALAQMKMGMWGKRMSFDQAMQHVPADWLDYASHSSLCAWEGVPQMAVEYLGVDLRSIAPPVDKHMGMDLFNCDLAPKYCTPAQAAEAVRSFDECGDPCWPYRNDELEWDQSDV